MQFNDRTFAHHGQSLDTGGQVLIVSNIITQVPLTYMYKMHYTAFCWKSCFSDKFLHAEHTIKVFPEAGEVICHPNGSTKPRNHVLWDVIWEELPSACKITLALGQRIIHFPIAYENIPKPCIICVHMSNSHDQPTPKSCFCSSRKSQT